MHYNYLNCKNVKIINLNDIYMGPEMYHVINIKGKELYGNQWFYEPKLILDNNLFSLSRINEMFKLFKNNIKLPPVKLKLYNNKYEIIDGRHRIVLSILFNYDNVPAIIID